jgi:hypothetical protein
LALTEKLSELRNFADRIEPSKEYRGLFYNIDSAYMPVFVNNSCWISIHKGVIHNFITKLGWRGLGFLLGNVTGEGRGLTLVLCKTKVYLKLNFEIINSKSRLWEFHTSELP